MSSTSGNPTNTALVESAAMELAARLQVPRSGVTIVSTRDSAEGLRLVLEVRLIGRVFDYLVADDGQPILQPSGEEDGGYGFVPPPGIRT